MEGDKVKIREKAGARTFGSLTAKVVVSPLLICHGCPLDLFYCLTKEISLLCFEHALPTLSDPHFSVSGTQV